LLGLHKIDHSNKITSIVYWLPKQNEGQGLMTKSVKALCNFCFTELDINRIEIGCATGNKKSQNIPKRLNFKLEGTLPQREIVNGKHLDYYLFSLLKSENSKVIAKA
jgi:ribosomal-protein-serine acetyltransferase